MVTNKNRVFEFLDNLIINYKHKAIVLVTIFNAREEIPCLETVDAINSTIDSKFDMGDFYVAVNYLEHFEYITKEDKFDPVEKDTRTYYKLTSLGYEIIFIMSLILQK